MEEQRWQPKIGGGGGNDGALCHAVVVPAAVLCGWLSTVGGGGEGLVVRKRLEEVREGRRRGNRYWSSNLGILSLSVTHLRPIFWL